MTGKAYYMTTLGAWQRHAHRFANSHWLALDALDVPGEFPVGAQHAVPGNLSWREAAHSEVPTTAHVAEPPSASGGTTPKDEGAASSAPTTDRATSRAMAVEGRGFNPAENDGRAAPSTLPKAVVHEGLPGRRLVEPGRSDETPERHGGASAPHSTDTATRTCPEPTEGRRRILVLIEADEGVHLSLEDDPAFEALPHPLAQKPISDAAQSALAPHGVPPGATTFDAAEAVARTHPLLKHRVF